MNHSRRARTVLITVLLMAALLPQAATAQAHPDFGEPDRYGYYELPAGDFAWLNPRQSRLDRRATQDTLAALDYAVIGAWSQPLHGDANLHLSDGVEVAIGDLNTSGCGHHPSRHRTGLDADIGLTTDGLLEYNEAPYGVLLSNLVLSGQADVITHNLSPWFDFLAKQLAEKAGKEVSIGRHYGDPRIVSVTFDGQPGPRIPRDCG